MFLTFNDSQHDQSFSDQVSVHHPAGVLPPVLRPHVIDLQAEIVSLEAGVRTLNASDAFRGPAGAPVLQTAPVFSPHCAADRKGHKQSIILFKNVISAGIDCQGCFEE